MPRAKKKVTGNSKSKPKGRLAQDALEAPVQASVQASGPAGPAPRANQNRPGQRKRGWRDIEAISERARLKKMLVDIWHEDVELDDDIFGECDHLSGYYTNFDEEEEIEIDEDLVDDEEEFEEKEE